MSDDVELITRCLDGDIDSFNRLVQRWEKRVYNFILSQIGNQEEAWDLCQKTFIQAYKDLERLRDPNRFSAWIYQIAMNRCKDLYRSRKRRPTQSLDGLEDLPEETVQGWFVSQPDSPEDMAHNRDLQDILLKALQDIPPEQRIVVVMKEYQGLKFSEIAEALEVPLNTVKSRMYYGLNALRQVFERWNIDAETVYEY